MENNSLESLEKFESFEPLSKSLSESLSPQIKDDFLRIMDCTLEKEVATVKTKDTIQEKTRHTIEISKCIFMFFFSGSFIILMLIAICIPNSMDDKKELTNIIFTSFSGFLGYMIAHYFKSDSIRS